MATSLLRDKFYIDKFVYTYNNEYVPPPPPRKFLKMYVPTLMYGIGFQTAKQWPATCNDVYCNDPECKPKPARLFTEQNYIEYERYYNQDTEHIVDATGRIPLKTKFRSEQIDNEVYKKFFTTDL